MVAGDGDDILIPAPAWPNYAGPLRLQGTRPVQVPMNFSNGAWSLDLDRLFAAVTPRTKAIVINSPSNPLGWTASRADLTAIRDFARKHGAEQMPHGPEALGKFLRVEYDRLRGIAQAAGIRPE